ncbi:TPA: hypothetical protein JG832_002490 [Enterobacter hormaechei subsp. xiangfangensis]|nr:hypothetical protein [Enterobacter hormaechei subsp. xiangfangensis]HAV1890625.1 hypothetical protein [Enterobacter hormaechei subsp. xiangfangensis]
MAKYESQSDVIRAIKKASDAELRALADISRQLGGMGGSGGLRVVRAANAGKYREPRRNAVGRTLEQVVAAASNGLETGSNVAQKKPRTNSTPAQVSLQTVRKSRQALKKATDETLESITSAVIESIESDIKAEIGTKAARRRTPRRPAGGGAPAGHYRDDAGRLRDSSGRYASKGANESAKNRRAGEDDEQKETNALLKRMLTGMARGAANATGEDAGNMTAGAAGMGVMWQASKELLTVVKDAGENTIKMGAWMNEGRKAFKNRKILRGFSANDARASVNENKKLAGEEARKESHQDNKLTHENQEKEIALLTELVHKSGKRGAGEGGGFLSGIAGAIGGGLGLGLLKKLLPESIRKRLPGGKAKTSTGEIDAEGSKKGRAGKVGKIGGEVEKGAGKAATKEAEKGAEKLAKGSLVKEGEAALTKGGLKAAGKIGLRAIPILGAIASIGIDAYQGYNDDEQLKETFGENAGRKERVAQAAANVADMGGLISGTSNLISGVLDGLGFTNAAQVMHMNGSTELAKTFDNLFSDSDKEADNRNESLLDKLGEIVGGITGLTDTLTAEGKTRLESTVATAAQDAAMLTAKNVQFAEQSTFNAKGEINQQRKAKGFTYNPQALITLGGKNASTRGNAMNNPTNLNFADQAGAMKEVGNSEARFAAFATPEEGIRAAGNQLLLNQKRGGLQTVSQIIAKWAPPTENRTQAYIANVAKTLGVTPDTKVDASDPAVTSTLISAIANYENGTFNMSQADVTKSLGTVQGGKYVGGWTDATQAELSKTEEGKAVLANNTGAGGKAIVPGVASAAGMVTGAAVAPGSGGEPGAAKVATAPGKPAPGVAEPSVTQKVVNGIKGAFSSINDVSAKAMPGLNYDASKAGIGLGAIKKTQIAPMLNGDALVNSSAKIALPSSQSGFGGVNRPDGIFSGALYDTFTNATQAINGQGIMGGLTQKLSPEWQAALSPLTNAAGNGINSVLNLGREAVGGWLNGSPSAQRSVTDLSASGARLSPDTTTQKAQQSQQTTLEEIAGYLAEMLGIQKKAPAGSPDKTKPGPQPGPTGEIPLGSQSSVLNQIIKKGER